MEPFSKQDLEALQETEYLLSVPGLYASLLEGDAESLDACVVYVF